MEHLYQTKRICKRTTIKLTLGFAALFLVLFFLSRPFINVGSDEIKIPRWGVFLNAALNPNFVNEIWFGVDLPHSSATGERVLATILGAFVVLAVYFTGRFLFIPFKRSLGLNRIETCFFAGTLGFVFLSFVLQIEGLLGNARSPLVLPLCIPFSIGLILTFYQLKKRFLRSTISNKEILQTDIQVKHSLGRYEKFLLVTQILLIILFSIFYICSSSQPLFEYDVLEYHAQSAREFFESGIIRFSEHNVYSNMPLGTEMFYLAGLNIANDLGFNGTDILRIGLLIGKTILTSAALLTAFGLFCFGVRFFNSKSCGLWSAIIFLSTPNVFEVYSNGLNDAILGLMLFTELYLILLRILTPSPNKINIFWFALLLGIFSGFAASVKYTGVVFVCIPIFFTFVSILFFQHTRHHTPYHLSKHDASDDQTDSSKAQTYVTKNILGIKTISITLVLFFSSSIIISGGWYLKNYVATGNPVYPLCYKFFGDSTNLWNESINERWQKAHSSSEKGISAMSDALKRSLWNDDFNSPFFILIPFVCLIVLLDVNRSISRKTDQSSISQSTTSILYAIALAIVSFWMLWFFTTHRLTRFLVPIIPCTALLIGAYVYTGLTATSRTLRVCVLTTLAVSLLYSGLLIDMLGQGRLAPLTALENDPARFPASSFIFNNDSSFIPLSNSDAPQKLLLIGEARACAYRVPVLYSTCWNDSPLMKIIESGIQRDKLGRIEKISSPRRIQEAFNTEGVKYLLVDFGELARFRSKGNYGFNNPEITPDLFIKLVDAGVIEEITPEEPYEISTSTQIFRVRFSPYS